jgi:AcrR family transcriptional regulator
MSSVKGTPVTTRRTASTEPFRSVGGTEAPPAESIQAASGRKRRQASVEVILTATRRLLAADEPVAKLSVDRILAEAGVSRATFYACFTDKTAVIARLARDSLAWRQDIHAEVLADPNLTREQLDGLLRAIVGHWQTNRTVLAAIIELAEHDPAMGDPWRAAVNQIAEQAADQFRVRWAEDPSAPANLSAIASAFTWMFERCCHQLVNDDTSAETTALAISEILWRTLTHPG